MKVSDIGELPPFFEIYINKINPELDLIDSLVLHAPKKLILDLLPNLKLIGSKVYADNKWTVSQILQHCIDTERIMAYRALCFARGEQAALPGFDENNYAAATLNNSEDLNELLLEFDLQRQANIMMFKNLSKLDLLKKGTASNIKLSALSLGFVITGHLIHHLEVIKERYVPLI